LDNVPKNATLQVTYVGYQTMELSVKSRTFIEVKMEMATFGLSDVVISNGMFNRKRDQYTGAVSTFSGEELRTIGVQNIAKSLSVLEPSMRMFDNIEMGSDPNRLPEVALRGNSGVPDLQSTYQNAPNLPLFILDGFETTVQRIYDLNMELVERVTVLKDASAKA